MSAFQAVSEKDGQWIFIVPVLGLRLPSAVNKEFKVYKVTLIDLGKLTRVRKRFGIPETIGTIKRKIDSDRVFKMADTFAIVRRTGKPKEIWPEVSRLIEEELQILSVSQLGYAKRRFNSKLSIAHSIANTSYLCLDASSRALFWNSEIIGKLGELSLDEEWYDFQKKIFFYNLWKIINRKIKVEESWRKSLYRAAKLVGQSLSSNNISQSFLWNMIAIELLLTKQGDKYSEQLPKRIEAFLGWVGFWKTQNYEEKIKEIYIKRSQFVHDGNESNISIEDLLFTDDLVLNLFSNLMRYHNLFDSKDKVIEFSKKVEAEFLLGIQSKVRPQKLTYISLNYNAEDYKAI